MNVKKINTNIFNRNHILNVNNTVNLENRLLRSKYGDIANSFINEINDYEVSVYRFEQPKLTFRVFFGLYIQWLDNDFLDTLKKYTNNVWDEYYDKLKKHFILTPDDFGGKFRNIDGGFNIGDLVSQSQYEEFLSFYNSFTYPFFTGIDNWSNDNFLYGNKPYLFNSFLKIDYFSVPSLTAQNLLFSQIVYTNPNNNFYETLTDENETIVMKPTYSLDNNDPGYQFSWFSFTELTEFYVRIQFWDALNGRLINLVPTTEVTQPKKWAFGSDDFNRNNLFLRYRLDSETNTFKIYEYNPDNNDYNISLNECDLYELIFDDEFADEKPNFKLSGIKNEDKEVEIDDNDFSFEIMDEYIDKYVDHIKSKYFVGIIKGGREYDFGSTKLHNNGLGDLEFDSIQLFQHSITGSKLDRRYTVFSDWRDEQKFVQRNLVSFPRIENPVRTPGGINYDFYFPIEEESLLDAHEKLFANRFEVIYNKDRGDVFKSGEYIDVNFRARLGDAVGAVYFPVHEAGENLLGFSYNFSVQFVFRSEREFITRSISVSYKISIIT